MNPLAWLSLGALAAGLLGGWTLRDWKADADQFKAQASATAREDAARAQGLKLATGYADLAVTLAGNRASDRSTIERIYQNAPPVPADCAAPAGVVRVLEDGVRRANAAAAGQPVAALPGPAAPAEPPAGAGAGPVGS